VIGEGVIRLIKLIKLIKNLYKRTIDQADGEGKEDITRYKMVKMVIFIIWVDDDHLVVGSCPNGLARCNLAVQ
jgi:hypothetical protein